jgi:glycerophosphoryl diester phosphodiesterase
MGLVFTEVPSLTLIGRQASFIERVGAIAGELIAPRSAPPERPRELEVIGHRGDVRAAAENTLAGCVSAIERGADGVEVDVCVTRDGHVVLCHDRDPNEAQAIARQMNGERLLFVPCAPAPGSELRKPVSELTLEELRKSHGYRPTDDSQAAEQGLATLGELCIWASSEPRARSLMFDVKLNERELACVEPLLTSLRAAFERHAGLKRRKCRLLCGQREVYALLRSELEVLRELHYLELVPDFELGGAVEVARELGAREVSIGITRRRLWLEARRDIVLALEARRAGRLDSVCVWGANDERSLRRVIRLGVDTVLTDEIALARKLVTDAQIGGAFTRATNVEA